MGRLTSEDVLKDNQTRDPDSIVSLSLTHKALSDVSCLKDFKNLERLDLGFNSLTSLEDLGECVNLKWLSVVQNKLQSLKGVEGLHKLTVLNAGKNKIRSLDEVQKLVSLRALIMNDNEIVSMCKLDELKYLNTIVLSRNPLRKMSLDKLKLLSKLSLSTCQLEAIDSSIKACAELKELRLAHNDIKTLPAELAHNKKIQNLDLGNNLISRWSDLKVLSSLQLLKNLNLQGNPIAENDKLVKKIKKLVPSILIFNSKPIEKHTKNDQDVIVEDSSIGNAHDLEKRKDLKEFTSGEFGTAGDHEDEKNGKKKRKKEKKKRAKEDLEKEPLTQDSDNAISGKKPKSKAVIEIIDDRDTPFMELLSADTAANNNEHDESSPGLNSLSSLVIVPAKKKIKRSTAAGSLDLQAVSEATEIGLGGPSAWDGE